MSTTWSIVAIAAYALGQWLLVVVLARLGSPEDVGVFALALALSAPIFMTLNMRLRLLQATDMADRFPFSAYLRLRVMTSVVALGATLLAANWWSAPAAFYVVVACVAAFKVAEAIQDASLGRFQQLERMDQVALSSSVASVLAVVAMAGALGFTGSLVLACASIAAVRLLQVLLFDLPRTIRLSSTATAADDTDRASKVATLASIAWPLGIAGGLDSLNTNLPRYFIAAFDGEASLGVFAAMMQISFAGFAVVNAVGQAWVRNLARLFNAGDARAFWRTSAELVGVAIGLGGAGILLAAFAGRWFLSSLYGPAFAVSDLSFVLVMTGGLFSYVALSFVFVFTSIGRRRVQIPLYLSGLIAATAACWFLVPRLGLTGGAWSMILANLAQVTVSIVVLAISPPFARRGK